MLLRRGQTGPTLTAREYTDWRLEELEKRLNMERTLLVTFGEERRQEMAAKLLTMNEFRSALADQAANFATRKEMESEVKSLADAIEAFKVTVSITRDTQEGRLRAVEQFQANITGRLTMIGFLGFVITIAVSIALHYLK